jgi:hypothetical protein
MVLFFHKNKTFEIIINKKNDTITSVVFVKAEVLTHVSTYYTVSKCIYITFETL